MEVPCRPMATWRTLDEAANQVGISRRTLQRWISEGRVHSYTIAGDRRTWVDLDEVRKLRIPRPKARPLQSGDDALSEDLVDIQLDESPGLSGEKSLETEGE